jgi:hypothetical protein
MKIINKIVSRVEERVRGLRPDRFIAQFCAGPVVIANSIPKGGTHLLTRCLSLFPRFAYTGIHYTRGVPDRDAVSSLLDRTGANRFSAAHLWWSDECAALFRHREVRQILMLRDPRDVAVSGVFFILNRKSHHLHQYFVGLPDMESRMEAYLSGVTDKYSTIGQGLADIKGSFNRYTAWSEEPGTLTIRFEDLVGSKGGGDDTQQANAVQRIAEHIGVALNNSQTTSIAEKIFFSRSVTFRKGAIGQWQEHFTENIDRTFVKHAGDLLHHLGYK